MVGQRQRHRGRQAVLRAGDALVLAEAGADEVIEALDHVAGHDLGAHARDLGAEGRGRVGVAGAEGERALRVFGGRQQITPEVLVGHLHGDRVVPVGLEGGVGEPEQVLAERRRRERAGHGHAVEGHLEGRPPGEVVGAALHVLAAHQDRGVERHVRRAVGGPRVADGPDVGGWLAGEREGRQGGQGEGGGQDQQGAHGGAPGRDGVFGAPDARRDASYRAAVNCTGRAVRGAR
ncbi:MAG: hypothetical protein H6704_30640 [Myxococcales bacterium]|nr:hypothetical protein [Myxococcales bacterium]